jgi:hypothetical protein
LKGPVGKEYKALFGVRRGVRIGAELGKKNDTIQK